MLFAILGLRTLYFVLEALKDMLHHLEKAIIVLLFFIAIKLALSASLHLTGYGYDISPNVSLLIVLGTLAVGVLASVFHKKEEKESSKNKGSSTNATGLTSSSTSSSAGNEETSTLNDVIVPLAATTMILESRDDDSRDKCTSDNNSYSSNHDSVSSSSCEVGGSD